MLALPRTEASTLGGKGGEPAALPSISAATLPGIAAVFVLATGAALIGQALGVRLDGTRATGAACLAMLAFGVPHGAFDFEIIADPRLRGLHARLGVLALYLGCAAAMYGLWRIGPGAALAAFLLIAVVHFSEDWRANGLRLTALATATAVVAAPALLHRDALGAVFVALTGDERTRLAADLLTLLAPTALAVAAVGLAMAWQAGRRIEALNGACALTAMLLLPPVVGFALFFCLGHSPTHFQAGMARLRRDRRISGGLIVAGLTFVAFGLAAAVFARATGGSPTRLLYAGFVTLSVLTLPHMAVPALITAWRSRRR